MSNRSAPPPTPAASPLVVELEAARADLALSQGLMKDLRKRFNEARAALAEDAAGVAAGDEADGRAISSGGGESGGGSAPAAPLLEQPAASASTSTSATLEARIAQLTSELVEAEAVVSRDAKRVREAEIGVAAEASEHNAEQPIVLLPGVLQRKIIDLLPIGWCVGWMAL